MGTVSGRRRSRGDVAVVGSGPNGLAAAVTLARAGLAVDVLEANAWPGGGAATRELTEPGFHHDLASAVHPMAVHSPFFRAFGLEQRVSFVFPQTSFAHALSPLDVVRAHRSLAATAVELGADGRAYARLLDPVVRHIGGVADLATGPLLRVPPSLSSAWALAAGTLEQGSPAWGVRFGEERAPALLTGAAAHTTGRHPRPAMAAAGLVLAALAHARGWPLPRGGSGAIAEALVEDLVAFGGRLRLGERVDDLPALLASYRTVVLNLSAREVLRIERGALPPAYRRRLARLRPGCGVSKVDYALEGPVPWRDPRLADVPTVHLGGTRADIAVAEDVVARGGLPERPYVLLVQPSVVDSSRAPRGRAVLWAYTHVPFGCPVDRADAIEAAIEEHAPGFRDRVLARHSTPASRLGVVSANFAGGDFASGAVTLGQLLRRPVARRAPWRTPRRGLYLSSGSAAPGPSVHGMAGWWAARTALADQYGLGTPDLAPVPRAAER